MRTMKWAAFGAVLLLFLAAAAGCGGPARPAAGGQAAYLTVTDDAGRTVVLPQKPVRIVALSPSFLEALDAAGCKLIGRPSTKEGVAPAAYRTAAEVGLVTNINVEKVAALQPDLVIGYEGLHDKLAAVLETNHIPLILVKMKTYRDVEDKLALFAAVAGEPAKGKQAAAELKARMDAVRDKLPAERRKVAILHGTAKSVTVELDGSIAGSTAKWLRLQNVAAGGRPLKDEPDMTPFSLEKLVEADPDLIFVVTMGDQKQIESRLRADMAANPAWASLRAVRGGAVYFLPPRLFLLNPGLHYPEAALYMARLAYPKAFADGR